MIEEGWRNKYGRGGMVLPEWPWVSGEVEMEGGYLYIGARAKSPGATDYTFIGFFIELHPRPWLRRFLERILPVR